MLTSSAIRPKSYWPPLAAFIPAIQSKVTGRNSLRAASASPIAWTFVLYLIEDAFVQAEPEFLTITLLADIQSTVPVPVVIVLGKLTVLEPIVIWLAVLPIETLDVVEPVPIATV